MEKIIRQQISSHFGFPLGTIMISKFFHGRPSSLSKVLFFCSDGAVPLCIVKMARVPSGNRKLENEMRGQGEAQNVSHEVNTPRVLFAGRAGDHALYAEEVVDGLPIGKDKSRALIEKIYMFQKSFPKKGVFPKKVLDMLFTASGRVSGIPLDALSYLQTNTADFFTADTHGDCTYMNVLTEGEKLCIIDWERFNERPIWGIDFVHYVIRACEIKNVTDFQTFLDNVSYVQEDEKKYFEGVYALDVLLDYLLKNDSGVYATVVEGMKHGA